MNNLEQSDKLIAEFMGFQNTSEGWYNNEEVSLGEGDNTFDDLKFHRSWDWLMPVIDKIYNLDISFETDTSNKIGDITHGLLDIDREKTYKAVVEFIKFYNQKL